MIAKQVYAGSVHDRQGSAEQTEVEKQF